MIDAIFDDEEKLTFLFQPDTLLSHQYFATFRRRQLEPEKRLMLAVLEDAVVCFQKYVFAKSRKKQKLFSEAEEWICDEDSDHVFSFENICSVLKFDPKYVREGLLRWKTRKLAERQSTKLVNLLSLEHESFISKRGANQMINKVNRPYPENKVARLG